jgi:uncharacterized protein (TIGR03643 family)
MNLHIIDAPDSVELYRTPFEAILVNFGLSESQVIEIMRKEMKASSFRMWRKRLSASATMHPAKCTSDVVGHKYNRQRAISNNKISKR